MTVREYLLDLLLDWLVDRDKSKTLPMVNNFTWYRLTGIGARAESGKTLIEPMGSTRDFADFNDLMFLPAQMATLPVSKNKDVNLQVTLGPNAKKPLQISLPVMVTGWGYGVSVKKSIRLAAAMAAEKAQTAVNSGEGGFLADEKELTSRYIVQYNRGGWGNSDEALQHAAMVEVWVGQGASAAAPTSMQEEQIGPHLREHFGLTEPGSISTDTTYSMVNSAEDWRKLAEELRSRVNGIPLAVKIAAGNIERDLAIAAEAGFDVVVVDGAQGGTAGSPEITLNNFGLPTAYALPRAAAFLEREGLKGKMSLVASGGLRDSGDILKALALGADAVYLGQAALTALLYSQLEKSSVAIFPTSLFSYSPEEEEDLDIGKAADGLYNFLKATGAELALATRLLGKTDIGAISKEDMVSLTPQLAAMTGVPLAYQT